MPLFLSITSTFIENAIPNPPTSFCGAQPAGLARLYRNGKLVREYCFTIHWIIDERNPSKADCLNRDGQRCFVARLFNTQSIDRNNISTGNSNTSYTHKLDIPIP